MVSESFVDVGALILADRFPQRLDQLFGCGGRHRRALRRTNPVGSVFAARSELIDPARVAYVLSHFATAQPILPRPNFAAVKPPFRLLNESLELAEELSQALGGIFGDEPFEPGNLAPVTDVERLKICFRDRAGLTLAAFGFDG